MRCKCIHRQTGSNYLTLTLTLIAGLVTEGVCDSCLYVSLWRCDVDTESNGGGPAEGERVIDSQRLVDGHVETLHRVSCDHQIAAAYLVGGEGQGQRLSSRMGFQYEA
mgnify:CR=1 FL=1